MARTRQLRAGSSTQEATEILTRALFTPEWCGGIPRDTPVASRFTRFWGTAAVDGEADPRIDGKTKTDEETVGERERLKTDIQTK